MSKDYFESRPHPWHGLEIGANVPQSVRAYIEMTPFDTVKYEIDKDTGYLSLDRPLRASSQLPSLYGFIPKTYCGDRVSKLMDNAEIGDGDPLDICVFSERIITRAEILINARVIGGIPMLDDGEADDKIIAVVEKDGIWGNISDISEFSEILVERVKHYFLTYKLVPGKENRVVIGDAYGKAHAEAVIQASIDDYNEKFV